MLQLSWLWKLLIFQYKAHSPRHHFQYSRSRKRRLLLCTIIGLEIEADAFEFLIVS